MRIFTIDHGNSNSSILKWKDNCFSLERDISNTEIPVIISSVSKNISPKGHINVKDIKNLNSIMPFEVSYPNSLGVDRLMCALGAYTLKSTYENILIIDAGTFTTIDLLFNNTFRGGMILPGDDILNESYLKGSELYQKHFEYSKNAYPLKSTEDSIQKSVPFLLQATYEKILRDHPIDRIFLTGGNYSFHEKIISSIITTSIKISCDPFLVHKGLHELYKTKLKTMGSFS